MKENIFQKVDIYISNLLAPEDKALTDVIKSLDDANIPQMSVSANHGKFLQILMICCNAKRVLELGTLGGYSTIWMARALPDNGKLITLEVNKSYADVARKNIENAGLTHKVEMKIGKAIDILANLISQNEEPFDFIIIDADKPPYLEYFEYAVKLSHQGTIIVCDNVVREGKILDIKSSDERLIGVQRLNESLKENKNVTATILQTVGVKEHDGMVIAVVNQN
ncbi:O-methyltransferase [Ferruginibacter sp.]|nr:O-methyltransferase [Ferruginibacter sp.]